MLFFQDDSQGAIPPLLGFEEAHVSSSEGTPGRPVTAYCRPGRAPWSRKPRSGGDVYGVGGPSRPQVPQALVLPGASPAGSAVVGGGRDPPVGSGEGKGGPRRERGSRERKRRPREGEQANRATQREAEKAPWEPGDPQAAGGQGTAWGGSVAKTIGRSEGTGRREAALGLPGGGQGWPWTLRLPAPKLPAPSSCPFPEPRAETDGTAASPGPGWI